MLNVVDTGDLSYVYASSQDKIVSAIPMHIKTMDVPVKNFNLSVAYFGSKRSPKFKSLTARNTQLFNRNNYLSNNEYDKVIRKFLEILPGDKSVLFFGGDFGSLDSLATTIAVAGDISYKTWMVASANRELLNNYWLNAMCSEKELPTNVWLYELASEEHNECLLHTYPALSYDQEDSQELEEELLQFPTEYKNFSIKVCP